MLGTRQVRIASSTCGGRSEKAFALSSLTDQINLLLDAQLHFCLSYWVFHKQEVLTCNRVSLLAQWLSLVHEGQHPCLGGRPEQVRGVFITISCHATSACSGCKGQGTGRAGPCSAGSATCRHLCPGRHGPLQASAPQ